MKRYQTFDEFDGSMQGLQAMPAGRNDTSSPGGMSSQSTHWTHGLFGKPDTHVDVYASTGERYPYGAYGSLYVPNSHAAIYSLYQGPSTAQTEYTTLNGEPYYWENMGHNQAPFPITSYAEKKTSLPHAYTPVNPDKNIERFVPNIEKQPLPTTIELIEPIEEISSTKKDKNIKKETPATPVEINDDSSYKKKLSLATLALIIIVFVTAEFWAETVHSFTKQYLNKGVDPSWIKYLIYALMASIVLVIFVTTL